MSIKGFAFNPATLEVAKGTTVTWTNEDGTTHTVSSGASRTLDGKFDQTVQAGTTFSRAFPDAGTFPFFCQIHQSMTGTVTVK